MDNDDLLARIQKNGRLPGRNESRRITCGVLTVLSELLPAPAYRRLTAMLPEDLRQRLPRPGAGRITYVLDSRGFIARITERLLLDGPSAAFLARVVFEQLNALGHGVTPATLAHLVPMDLRPLISAGATATAPVTARVARPAALRSRPARHQPVFAEL